MATINKSNRAGLERILSPVVDITGVCKQYGEIQALLDVDLRVESGVTGVLGPNGSGKSTLIKALARVWCAPRQVVAAFLVIRGPIMFASSETKSDTCPKTIVTSRGWLGSNLSPSWRRLSGLPGTEGLRRAHEIMDFCDIGEERYREVETYSTGMRQKLKFAQALVHDPPLLILDEPTTGLDPDQRQSMLSRIKTLAREHGKTVMLSTHILPDVRSVCDQVVMLVRGTVRLSDSLDNLSRPSEPTIHVSVYGDTSTLGRPGSPARTRGHGRRDGSLRVGGVSDEQTSLIWQLGRRNRDFDSTARTCGQLTRQDLLSTRLVRLTLNSFRLERKSRRA